LVHLFVYLELDGGGWVSSTPCPLYLLEKSPRYRLTRELGGSRDRSGCLEDRKYLVVSVNTVCYHYSILWGCDGGIVRYELLASTEILCSDSGVEDSGLSGCDVVSFATPQLHIPED
jgi:hypothetical protein